MYEIVFYKYKPYGQFNYELKITNYETRFGLSQSRAANHR